MGGMNPLDKMKAQGLDLKKGSHASVAVGAFYFAPEGHVLHHPRASDPLDEVMVLDIMENGVEKRPLVWNIGPASALSTAPRLLVIDGARRIMHAREAERRMHASGALAQDKAFYVEVDFYTGDERGALLERLKRNTDPLKKEDAPSKIALTAIAYARVGGDIRDLLPVVPRSIGESELRSMLRWHDLLPEVAAEFDAGTAPIGLLGAVLDAPREEQGATLTKLVDAGMTTAKGATRLLNKEKRAQGQKVGSQRVQAKVVERVVEAVDSLTLEEGDTLDDLSERATYEVQSTPNAASVTVESAIEIAVALGFQLALKWTNGDASALDQLPASIASKVRNATTKGSK